MLLRPAAAPKPPSAIAPMAMAGALALLALYAIALIAVVGQHLWPAAANGAPTRIDFAEFWSAGRVALTGHAADAYDWRALLKVIEGRTPGAFGSRSFPFYYPPPVLLGLAPLGLLSFAAAAAVWMTAGVAAYAAAIWAATRETGARLVALASPAAFICLLAGQNGLLTAALAGGVLALHRRRPLVAGVLLGLLVMKPQLAVLFPVALLAAGRWKTLATAAVTALALAALATLAFGPSVWTACLHAMHPGPGQPAPMAGLPPAKLLSVYGLGRVLGLGASAAMIVQVACAAAAVAWTGWLWRGDKPFALRAAGVCFAALLFSPYNCIYDLPIAGVGLAYLLDSGGRRFTWVEGGLMAAAYLLPLAFFVYPYPYGPPICLTLCVLTAARLAIRRPRPVSLVGAPVTA
jgi:arabinofuranan 3-O-arabinosyltransferase